MLCFFFFLNCLILWCFPYFIYYYLDASGSPDAQFSYHEGREARCVSTVHSSLALCCPLCTLKRLLSQSFLCCGSSVLKALPTCLYVGRSRRLDSPRMSCCHLLPWQFLCRFVGLDSISSQVRGTKDSGRWPPPLLKTKKKNTKKEGKNSHGTQSINQSLATDELSFIREVRSNVCVTFPKNQYLVSDVCTAEPRVHFPTAECVCCISAVLHQTPWFFYKSSMMQRCWPFEWDSRIFFYMVVFVWRRKKKRSLFCKQIWCKKKKKSSSKKLVFHSLPSYPKNLSFAIIVICSTFVNTMFLINVHRHECQYNCKRF